jgi:hypothetical protein
MDATDNRRPCHGQLLPRGVQFDSHGIHDMHLWWFRVSQHFVDMDDSAFAELAE